MLQLADETLDRKTDEAQHEAELALANHLEEVAWTYGGAHTALSGINLFVEKPASIRSLHGGMITVDWTAKLSHGHGVELTCEHDDFSNMGCGPGVLHLPDGFVAAAETLSVQARG